MPRSVLRRAASVIALVSGMATVIGVTASPASAAPNVVVGGLGVDKFLSFDSGLWGPDFATRPPYVVGIAFAPNGQIYAADKLGRVLMFNGPGATVPVVTLDIRSVVHDNLDRGLLGIALDPQFGSNGYVYILYTYDKDPFADGPVRVPAWGGNGFDDCGPSQASADKGCVVTARLSRFQVDGGGHKISAEQVLVESNPTSGWCEQFPSHSIGTLAFGADGKLYAGAGDGASFAQLDWGQYSTTNPQGVANPCADPPAARGGALGQPSSEGGSLRSQSVRSTFPDTYSPLDGAIIRINRDGSIPSDNPLVDNGVPGDDRIVAFGMRNPFRFTIKPGTNELWIGDVGNGAFEEVNRFTFSPTSVPNFGWPCFEGPDGRYSNFSGFGFTLCTDFQDDVTFGRTEVLGQGATAKAVGHPTAPYLAIPHPGIPSPEPPVSGCNETGGSAIVGGGFSASSSWPGSLQGAYVVGDYARACVWAVPAASQGNPTTASMVQLATNIEPVQIVTGPDGNVYVTELPSNAPTTPGAVWRFGTGPSAVINASPTSGPVPLTVNLDASGSKGTGLSYSWDLDGNGTFGDATSAATSTVVTTAGQKVVSLRVTDIGGRQSTANQTIQAGTVPVINSITSSAQANGWSVGDTITYSADAFDPGGGTLSYRWNVVMKHCSPSSTSTDCHEHVNIIGSLPDAASGSFSAPGHEWRAILRVELTVTDASGLSATQSIDLPARGQALTVLTDPPGLSVGFVDQIGATPFTATVTEGDPIQVNLRSLQVLNGKTYVFAGWRDAPKEGADRVVTLHEPQTISAVFSAVSGFNPVRPVRLLDTRDGTGGAGGKLTDAGAVRLQVTGANGVPAGATAAVLNITATESVGPGYVTAYPCDSDRPLASNVNYAIGETVANLSQVRLASDGSVCLFSQRAAHLVVDLSGYFAESGQQYRPVDPTRVLDTRLGIGAPQAKVGPLGEIVLDLSSQVPAGATAAVLNLTATENLFGPGYVSAYPCGGERPFVSNLNSRLFDTRPNLAVVPLGPGATVCLYSQAQIDLVADLAGWYVPGGSGVSTQNPLRVLDTRENFGAPGPMLGDTTITLNLDNYAPAGATAVVMNVTSVEQSREGYITAWPCGERPVASNLNVLPKDTRPNLVMVRLSAARTVCLYTQQTTNLLADLAGWTLG